MNMQKRLYSYRTPGCEDMSNYITDDIRICSNDNSGMKLASLSQGVNSVTVWGDSL